jgi:hypothetical protein
MTGPRVSPDGSQVAVIEHPAPFDDFGFVVVIDRAGRSRRVGGTWASTNGVAWGPHGQEIWLAGSPREGLRALHAISLSGDTRLLARIAGPLSLLDVSPKGEALVACDVRRIGLMAVRPQWPAARELTVFDSSVLADLSADGAAVLSTEIGQTGGPRYSVYLRRDPDAPAVRLGDGFALALSPDGRFALALVPGAPPQLVAYPTGTGQPLAVTQASPGICRSASFFPDGQRLVLALSEAEKGTRLYVQEFPSGASRLMSPTPVLVCHLQGFPVSPDGKWIAAVGADERLALYSVEDGSVRPLERLPAGLVPIRWLADGRSLLAYRLDEFPACVRRVSIADGQAEPLLEIRVADPDGVQGFASVRFTPDGRSYAYSYARFLSDLYTVSGID